jgi:hypothetical protein
MLSLMRSNLLRQLPDLNEIIRGLTVNRDRYSFNRNIFLATAIVIVLSMFFLSACKTIKAAVSFEWGKITESVHQLEAKKAQKEYPSTSNPEIKKDTV